MTSILKVDTIQGANGSDIPYIKNHVLQVKQDILRTVWLGGTSSTAFEDTPLSVTITPQSTSSNILITGMINYSGSGGAHLDFKVVRNGADILLSTSTMGSRIKSHIHNHIDSTSPYQIHTATLNLLDAPSSTSALTYKLQVATPNTASFQALLNRSGNDTDDSYNAYTVSTITVQEIGG